MSRSSNFSNERHVQNAFDEQSAVFDKIYAEDLIIQYKRARVRSHVQSLLPSQSHILELNAGTGEDATWFARHGHSVHATDISERMQNILREKVHHFGLDHVITTENCSFTDLEHLKARGPYDLIFSNFAGLNCTGNLDTVLASFSTLLRPGGYVTLVILPSFCFWETLLAFKGKTKTAFRRFFSSKGRKAHIEGEYFRCWYYNPGYIQRHLQQHFKTMKLEGLCTFVPPSYIEHFGEKHPKLFTRLKSLENRWKAKWPWRSIGDYYIISLKKNEG